MLIEWLGHASFLIISSNGTKIITDPYEPGAFGGGISYRPIEIEPDIVTVSHDHADHGYIEGLPNHFSVVATPGSRTVKGIDFKGVKSYHDPEQGTLRGNNIMFVMNIDRMRVCHLGDLGEELPSGDIEELGGVDILLIPVGGYYTIGPEEATRLIEWIKPRVVIPMHFKTEKVDLPIGPVEPFLQGKANVRRLNASEFEITREQLPDQREIVVLKHAL